MSCVLSKYESNDRTASFLTRFLISKLLNSVVGERALQGSWTECCSTRRHHKNDNCFYFMQSYCIAFTHQKINVSPYDGEMSPGRSSPGRSIEKLSKIALSNHLTINYKIRTIVNAQFACRNVIGMQRLVIEGKNHCVRV